MRENRTGIGVDIHALRKGSHLRIGGTSINCGFELVGHSDGDVLTHAIIDGILGASGLGDIGFNFPSSNVAYRGINSLILLERTVKMAESKGWMPTYIDATIVAQSPDMSPHILKMKDKISNVVKIKEDEVSIKATTTDNLGFIGKEMGIACFAVVTVGSLG